MSSINDTQWNIIIKFSQNLVEYLAEQYEIGDLLYPTVHRNRKSSMFQYWRNKKVGQLVFGYGSFEYAYTEGFREYKTVFPHIPQLHRRNVTGIEAVYFIVIHEFAHALQYTSGDYQVDRYHGPKFVKWYQELLTLLPFEEVAAQFLTSADRLILADGSYKFSFNRELVP